MRKLFIVAFALSAIAAVSCEKERTCVCTEVYEGENNNYTTVSEMETEKSSKIDATQDCETQNIAEQTVLTETYSKTCELK
jgi:hypothetical protein